MALNTVARVWSPYKELQYTVESAILKKQPDVIQDLEAALRKHKADFISLLQNPAKNAAHREIVRNAYKEGLPVHGQQGTRLLSQQFIQEALTLSDLFDLNEYAAVELLLAGESQQPFFPGFKRGLVAVLLYYDGRSSLVSSLRTLIQARKGRTWSLDLPEDVLSVIMNFTTQLMNEGLATKILYVLETMDVTKEIDRLQSPQFRALGPPRHRRQVTDKIKEIKLTLADCLFCWCCQLPLSKAYTQALLNYLRNADDDNADGTLSDVTVRLLMALLYSIDPRVPENEQGSSLPKLPIFTDPTYVPALSDDILSDKSWKNRGLLSVVQFAWAMTLHTLSQYPDLQASVTEYFEKDEMLIDLAVEQDVFFFLHNSVLANPEFHNEEYYVRQMHNILTDFIVQMPLKMKELRNRGDETSRIILANQQNGLEPPAGLRRDFEHFLYLIGDLYMKDSPDRELALEFWYMPDSIMASTAAGTPYTYRPSQRQISLYKFVRLAGDLLSPPLFIPYLYMLRGLANGHHCAHHCFNLLQNNGIGGGSQVSNVSWDHFFMSMNQYYSNLRQETPMTSDLAHVYRHHPRAISAQEVDGLIAVTQLLRQVAFWDEHARIALCENRHSHLLVVLLGLVTCDVPAKLKSELLRALAAFCKTPDIAATLWQSLEASQIIPTISFGALQKHGGLQVELEEIEARDEEFPITRGFLELMSAMTDNSIPGGLGSGYRSPGFMPYLEFLRDSIFLKFNTRAYRDPAEKWQIGMLVLEVLYKILADYEVSASDFIEPSVDVQSEGCIMPSKQPGFILMQHMLNDSNMLKMILFIIYEATKMLDKYILFPGKEYLEQAALWCLKMIETTCSKQEKFLDALRDSDCDIIVSQMDKLLMSINRRSGKADHLVNLAKYITYNSWLVEHALSAVHILSMVSLSPIVQPHIVGLFTADQEISQNILHGFVECLENPEDPEDGEDDILTNEDPSTGRIRNATRQEILRLILCTLNQPAPNLAHYLLGFETRKPVSKTDLQDPGVLGCPRTCLHALLSLLNRGLDSQHRPSCVTETPRLAELGYHLIYVLCADSETSGAMMRYLRTHDFLYQHLQHLPFTLQDSVDGSTSASQSHLLAQESWLLRTTAIELRLTSASRQRSHTQRLLNLLMDDTPFLQQKAVQPDSIYVDEPYSQYDLEYSMFTSTQIEYHQAVTGGQSLRKIISILDAIDFSQEMPPVLQLEVFNPALVEQVVSSCERKNYLGLTFTDIQLLHRVLTNELHATQSSATGKRPRMIQEIQEICANVVARNTYRELLYSKKQAFDAWRQVVEIILTACPEDLLHGEPRQSVIFELLQDLLAKVSKEDAIPELAAPVAGVILTLMANLRMCFLKDSDTSDSSNNITQYVTMLDGVHASVSGHVNMFNSQASGARTLFASSLQVVLKRLLEHMMRSGSGGARVRAYLYGALLHYLQIAQKPRILQMELGSQGTSIVSKMTSKENEYERLTRENMETISSCGDNLMEVVCRDACDGHDIGRTLALATLDLILCLDKAGSWLSHLSSKGYLQHIIDSLLEDDNRLKDMLQQQPQSLKVLYIFESKIGLLTRIAQTVTGAQTLLQCGLTKKLAECSIFDFRPERESASDSFVPSVMSRYRQQILFPVLKLCLAVLTSMGVENRLASQQVIKFILAHERVFNTILCDHHNSLQLEALQELALTTSVIGRAALDESLDEAVLGESTLIEYRGTLFRIQRHMLALLTPYSQIERLQKQLSTANIGPAEKISELREEAELAIEEIACNVVAFCRAMLSKSGPRSQFFGILFQPSLSEAMGKDMHTLEGLQTPMLSSSRSQNLGIIVYMLQQCTQQFLAAFDSHKHHTRKYTNVANLTAEEVREFCFLSDQDKLSSHQRQHLARHRLQQIMSHKAKQIQLFSYIVENCLYILWHHLEFYFLHCIPSDSMSSLVKIHTQQLGKLVDSPSNKHPASAKLANSVKREDLNQLKQDAVICINETLFKRLLEMEQCFTRGRTHYGFIEALIRRLKRLLQLHADTA